MEDTLTDEQLMLRYREGDLPAFQELYARHGHGAFRFLTWRSPRPEWVDQIFTETWCNLQHVANRYISDANFRVFLYICARNRLFDMLREYQQLFAVGPGHSTVGRDPLDALADAVRESFAPEPSPSAPPPDLRATMFALPSEQKEAVILLLWDGMELGDIAQIAGVTVDAVRRRLYAAFEALDACVSGRAQAARTASLAQMPLPLGPVSAAAAAGPSVDAGGSGEQEGGAGANKPGADGAARSAGTDGKAPTGPRGRTLPEKQSAPPPPPPLPDNPAFDAFALREGEVARQVKALLQPVLKADLGVAILKRVKFALTQDARPVAAPEPVAAMAPTRNEAPARKSASTPPPARKRSPWPAVAALLVSVAVGVAGQQLWHRFAPAGGDDGASAGGGNGSTGSGGGPGAPTGTDSGGAGVDGASQNASAPASDSVDRQNTSTQHIGEVDGPIRAAPVLIPDAEIATPIVGPSPVTAASHAASTPYSATVTLAPADLAVPASAQASASVSASASASVSASTLAKKKRSADPASAKVWLSLIEALRADGQRSEALAEWRKFRAAYPDYPVPEPLASQMRVLQR